MADALTLLRAHKVFAGLNEAHTSAIAAIARVATPAVGEAVFKAGDTNANLFFVAAGEVAVLVTSAGNRVELGRLGAGEVLGGLSLLTPAKHAADAEAGAGCLLVIIPLVELQKLSKQTPNVTSQLVFRLMRLFATSARALGLQTLFQ